jgi:hypothetical protein
MLEILKHKKRLCVAWLAVAISGCAGSVPEPPAYELCTLLIDRGVPSWFCVDTKSGKETSKRLDAIRLGVSVSDYERLKNYEATLIRWGKDNCRVGQ